MSLRRIMMGMGGTIPFGSNALFWLDGTVQYDSGSYYFIDRTGNGRRFLITGYDWDSSTVTGMPYKTAATISAPAGDATLIAADVNNYLYTGGVPNEISVVSLFQNVDYENKLFCRHLTQTLNDNLEEVREPSVVDIVLYNTVKSGADLTSCNNYYSVPVEETSNVHWISKTGNDSNAGTKASPWLTLNKATNLSGTAGYTVYVKSGTYTEGASLTFIKAVNVVCLGRVEISCTGSTYVIAFGAPPITYSLKGAVVGKIGSTTTQTLYNFSAASTGTFTRCWIKNATSGAIQAYLSNITFSNCVFSSISGTLINSGDGTYATNVTVTGCFSSAAATFLTGNQVALHTFNIKYNKLKVGTTRFGNGPIVCNYLYNTIDNATFTSVGSGVDNASTVIRINYNETLLAGISISDAYNYRDIEIAHNVIQSSASSARIYVFANATTISIHDNILLATGVNIHAGIGIFPNAANAKTASIYNNYVYTTAGTGSPLQVGDEVSVTAYDSISGAIYNNTCITNQAQTAHGVIVFNQSGFYMRRNYSYGFAFSYLSKCKNYDLSDSDVSYNVTENCGNGLETKGGYNQKIFNNIVINPTANGFKDEVYEIGGTFPTSGTIFKNNIIVETGAAGTFRMFNLYSSSVLSESENNVLYSLNNSNRYSINSGGTTITLAAWQALGFDDTYSIFTNPNINSDGVPSSSILIGYSFGAPYNVGLDVSTNFGNSTTLPSIVTKDQPGTGSWQVGAYVI